MVYVTVLKDVQELASKILEAVYRATLPASVPARNPKYAKVIPAPDKQSWECLMKIIEALNSYAIPLNSTFVRDLTNELVRQFREDQKLGAVPIYKGR